MWGNPLRVPQEGAKADLLEQGRLLESQLNRMSRNADWAVMTKDPIKEYERADSMLK